MKLRQARKIGRTKRWRRDITRLRALKRLSKFDPRYDFSLEGLQAFCEAWPGLHYWAKRGAR